MSFLQAVGSRITWHVYLDRGLTDPTSEEIPSLADQRALCLSLCLSLAPCQRQHLVNPRLILPLSQHPDRGQAEVTFWESNDSLLFHQQMVSQGRISQNKKLRWSTVQIGYRCGGTTINSSLQSTQATIVFPKHVSGTVWIGWGSNWVCKYRFFLFIFPLLYKRSFFRISWRNARQWLHVNVAYLSVTAIRINSHGILGNTLFMIKYKATAIATHVGVVFPQETTDKFIV